MNTSLDELQDDIRAYQAQDKVPNTTNYAGKASSILSLITTPASAKKVSGNDQRPR